MPISASAVLRMNRYGRLAEAAYARGDFAESYAYNLLAHEFAGAVEAIADSEPAKFIGVMANVVPTQVNGEAGYAKGDKVQMNFRWTYHNPVPFNEYDVDLQVVEFRNGRYGV